jgi:FKBP-type peptidyl-prolyl cis-trans isomerase
MTKSFVLFAICGVLALGVFAYFIFGLNPGAATTSQSKTNPSQTSPTPLQQTKASLEIKDITEGTGAEVKTGDTVVVHYKGTLQDGTQFDSSYGKEPFETQIGVGAVIQGWDMGISGMKVGGKRQLTIPPHLGYGAQGSGSIPPNSTLLFEVELLEIK